MREGELWELQRMGRHSSVPPSSASDIGVPHQLNASHHQLRMIGNAEDLHAWSIYRQNLNSDFTDSALGTDKSAPPYGNFQLRESTMQSILNNPKYGPRSELGTNMFTYLKFGLPRVLPPGKGEQGPDNSSGYDSTDEEVGYRGQGLRAARSEDVLNRPVESRRYKGVRDGRVKSASEANLLGSDVYYDQQETRSSRKPQGRGYLNQGLVEDERGRSRLEYYPEEEARFTQERARSQLSIASRVNGPGALSYKNDAPLLNESFFPRDVYGSMAQLSDVEGFKYPHLQLRNLSYTRGDTRVLDNINIEARGGEIVAVLATKSEDGSELCRIIANRHQKWGSKLRADIVLNGIICTPERLEDRVALVEQNIEFTPDMSVRQTLLFHSFLREPGTLTRGRDTKGRINALIEDLGLSQVKHTRVADLTVSEKQRLNVACHLLLDTDIVILDQPTRGMDIFDTFFLVEYLRQWAARGRIVILTIHPPTYEIFTMISKVVLISSGKLMYFGKRREMLAYFAFIEYPCPAYKNPSDYYLDLVTKDDLSPEAMLESSQRIDTLGATYRRKAQPLSDPGPPGMLPPKIRKANLFMQIFGLWIRALIYMYPFNVISWVKILLVSGIMSVCLGGVFVGTRWRFWDDTWQKEPEFEQYNIADRVGFHHVMLVVGVWPTLLHLATDIWAGQEPVHRDLQDKLYSKFAYLITKSMYSIPAVGGIFLLYSIPSYLLTGIHYPSIPDLNSFYLYIGT
ncbi:ATP-binding cassette sub-family G member 8 [Eurytemora carolleeae]|uniref:ATP-binding cassette sub-family G member 8 n=1 Tax=Eurytemora carolleeae TaxID=1294199 RepID=UPI000C77A039|nr:ATP-binding cassette sub-family G member 8 [Eurytemora carolleeae]|eukprot:XP_023342184.1 ATP-binding cassette sub-family G member 8-like [Eurytemora affinis]